MRAESLIIRLSAHTAQTCMIIECIFFPVKMSQATNAQTAILDRFGPKMHCAMQNRQMELHYLRKLSESIIPFLLPPESLQCR